MNFNTKGLSFATALLVSIALNNNVIASVSLGDSDDALFSKLSDQAKVNVPIVKAGLHAIDELDKAGALIAPHAVALGVAPGDTMEDIARKIVPSALLGVGGGGGGAILANVNAEFADADADAAITAAAAAGRAVGTEAEKVHEIIDGLKAQKAIIANVNAEFADVDADAAITAAGRAAGTEAEKIHEIIGVLKAQKAAVVAAAGVAPLVTTDKAVHGSLGAIKGLIDTYHAELKAAVAAGGATTNAQKDALRNGIIALSEAQFDSLKAILDELNK